MNNYDSACFVALHNFSNFKGSEINKSSRVFFTRINRYIT